MTDTKTGFWDRIENYPLWRLVAYVFLFALSERIVVTLVFFLRWGWHTVSGIELWFYYGVAKGTFELYSAWDPSWWILKALGSVLSGLPLLYGTYTISSISSSLNAALFCLFVSEFHNKKTGFLAGLIYGSMVLPMFNSAGTVTHDIFAYPYLILSVYGAVAAVRRKGWWKLPFACLCVLALFLGRHVGPTIYVGVGTIGLYLLWQAVVALLEDKRLARVLALILTPLLTLALVYFGGTFVFDSVDLNTLLLTLVAVAAFFGVWEVVRLGLRRKLPGVLLALFAAALFIFGWLLLHYRVMGKDLSPQNAWSWLIIMAAVALISFLLFRFSRSMEDLGHFPVAIFLVILFILVVLLQFEVTPQMMDKTYDLALKERGIDVRAQIKAGSGDLLASSLGDYWLRFNFLLFFLPVGLWVAFRKKDVLGWALILSGFIMSLAADRGTRPLTFGFALMGALAFVNWRIVYSWMLALWMCFIIGLFGGKYSTEYAVFFPVAGLFIYYSIQWPRESRSSTFSFFTLIFSLFVLLIGFILLSSSSLRNSLGLFSLLRIPGGLLRHAPGWTYLFISLGVASVGLLIYLIYRWIIGRPRPGWIWTIFTLTVLWMVVGSILGGATFQAKQLGNPDDLRLLEGIKTLDQPRQVEAINAVLANLNRYVGGIRKYWSVQLCLIVPGLILILVIMSQSLEDKKSRKQLLDRLMIECGVIIPLLVVLLLVLGIGGFWKNLYLILSPLFGALVLTLVWPRRSQVSTNHLSGVVMVCWLFATVIPSMNQTAKSTEGEYLVYKWLEGPARGQGRIFVPWSDGYMAEVVSGVDSELSPENIDFNLPRVYWSPEETAAKALRSKGLTYLMVSTKYFKLLRFNKKTGEFQYSFSPDIIYQPQQMGIKNITQLQQTTLYRLLYRPQELTHFRLLHYERDLTVNEAYLMYGVLPEGSMKPVEPPGGTTQ